MTITKIKRIANTSRFHLYADEVWQGIFLDETIAYNHLKVGQEIDEANFLKIKKENGKKVSFDMAVSYMEKYISTQKKVKDYLKSKGFDDETISETIKKLKEYGYINDENFAKNYFESLSGSFGKRAIANKLLSKGVAKNIVEELIENVDEDSQLMLATKETEKFCKNRENSPKTAQKCLAHLVYKGYDYFVAQQAVKVVLKNQGEEDAGF